MGVYESLGLRRIVNAQGRYTSLGGSLLPEPVCRAMVAAARGYVDLFELHRRAGARIAELTRNEAAYITNGATGGLFIAALACMTRQNLDQITRLPDLTGVRDQIVVHRIHRQPMDPAVLLTGARFVEIGNRLVTHHGDLEAALSDRTAAVLYTAGPFYQLGTLSLPEVVEVAHARGVPVIVNAAEQVPPVENLWCYTRELGCDLAVFSGGKGICGPQSSGIVVGRADLVAACYANGFPHTRFGRALKVGKEEIAGLLVALELVLAADRPAQIRAWNTTVADWADHLIGHEAVDARVVFPSWSPDVARLLVEIRPSAGFAVQDLRTRMLDGDPPVAVEIPPNTSQIYVNPECLEPGEEKIVRNGLCAAIADLAKSV